jgi:hypothetical protein
VFAYYNCKSQQLSNFRTSTISVSKDTIQIDTLSIIPNSVILFDSTGKIVDSSFYKIDYPNSRIIFDSKSKVQGSKFKISYRGFPYLFTKPYFHKNPQKIQTERKSYYNELSFSIEKNSTDDIFKTGGLNKNGSISRGVSFGNNQDVVVNSNLNMQLSGKLTDNIEIVAAISDNNIPIQPEGNTQQLQEFDKVFIELSNENFKLTAGDFEIKRPESYFMNFNKKVQGLSLGTKNNLSKNKKDSPLILKTFASAAVSKGKYARNLFNGIERNQGPYKLKGANNELFIVVLSGTEKVYIDGALIKRGQDYDYIIDYNTAEITFTPKQLITKDSRIVVEFEYSDKNYSRSTFFVGNELESKKVKIKFNIYSEQDSKNQPLQQNLTPQKKILLKNIGNNLDKAIFPNIDSVGFDENEVLYKIVDTTVHAIHYDTVFVYSTNSDSAKFRLGFSLVGQGKGNYVQINSTANGKVFKWIAPDTNGVLQGSYEPVELLVTPKMQQLYTLGFDYFISKRTKTGVEVAMSNNDLNLFSPLDDKNNQGFAVKYYFENTTPLSNKSKNTWSMTSSANYEFKNIFFNPLERYRSSEFERDWNIANNTANEYEHLSGIKFSFANKKNNFINYQLNSFIKGTDYNAYMNLLNTNLNKKNFFFTFDGSFLNSTGIQSTTQFIRQKACLTKKMKVIAIGAKEEQEVNTFRKAHSDTLQQNSFSFRQFEGFIQNSDSTKNKFLLNYKHRLDYAPKFLQFRNSTIADEAGAMLELVKNANNQFKLNFTYRNLAIADTEITKLKSDYSLLGRLEYNTKFLKGVFNSGTYYEIGSGLEVKKEFYYVKVATGQGVYSWTDYNNNGIPELNEFEIAAFTDQANYIRVFVPTDKYIKSNSNQFNEVFNINPYIVYNNAKGFKKIISRLSNQTIYHVDHKTTINDALEAYNPFNNRIADSSLLTLNSSFRNTFYFNRNSSKYGIELGYQENNGKTLLVNGFDSKSLITRNIKLRWNIIREIALNAGYTEGNKNNKSEYLNSRDYTINYFETENTLSFQPNTFFRTSLNFTYTEKKNKIGLKESSINRKSGIEIRYNIKANGSLMSKINYINISYSNANNNTPVAFEMLEGLKAGQNITWNLMYQQNLSNNLQMNVSYEGRKSEGTHAIHTGSVQLRAFF